MKVRNSNLGQFIRTVLDARLKINLRLNHTDPIMVQFTRTELRGFTGALRIENATIMRMIEELREYGYDVSGEGGSEHFVVTLDVKKWMTEFTTLDELVSTTQSIGELLEEPLDFAENFG